MSKQFFVFINLYFLFRKQSILPKKYSNEIGNEAAYNGQQEVIEWISKQSDVIKDWSSGLTVFSVSGGQLNLLIWLIDKKYYYDETRCCLEAIDKGHLNLLQQLLINHDFKRNKLEVQFYERAAKRGHLHILKWLCDKSGFRNSDSIINSAAKYGHQHIIEWLLENGVLWSSKTMYAAVKKGQLDLLEWAYNERSLNTSDRKICKKAVKHGQLEVLKWVKSQNCVWDEEIFSEAVKSENIEIMEWMKDNNCPWDKNVYFPAIKMKNIEIIKWLKDNGCPWNESVCEEAVKHKNLDALIWLRDNGFLEFSVIILSLGKV